MVETKKRVLDADVLMPEYKELLKSGAVLPLTVSGGSMRPFLSPGRDTVYLRSIDRELRRGDIVFYRRSSGDYVLHRLFRKENGAYWFVGDAQDEVEGPLPESCAFAVAACVRRKGRKISRGDLLWDFFAGAWLACTGRRRRILKAVSQFR